MEPEDLTRKQLKGLLMIAAILFGILVVPPALQYLYGVDAVKTAFVVIILYFLIDQVMKKDS